MTEEEREQLREFFVKYQLMYKLGIDEVEYTHDEYRLYNTMRDKHTDEYIDLWEEVAKEYNGEPWLGGRVLYD